MTRGPKTFSDAIDSLENADAPRAEDPVAGLEQEFRQIWKTLEGLNPNLGADASRVKYEVEAQFTKNPWLVLGLAGLLGVLIGFVFGRRGGGR